VTDIDFTPDEKMVLQASADYERTIRRRRIAVGAGGLMLAGILVAWYLDLSRELVLVAFAVYVIGAIVERVAYANAVLAYKRLVRKLLADRPRPNRPPE
jgi:hypothetical protein